MKRRLWKTWPRRILKEFNELGGILGGIGLAATIIPFVYDKPSDSFVGQVLIVLCTIGFCVSCCIVFWRSWPDAIRPISEVYGKSLRIEDLAALDPPPLRVGIVGPSYSGKSTLISKISARDMSRERTTSTSALIVQIPTLPNRAVALIDGGGQYFADQFKVAEWAEVLIVIIDHNQSETEKRINKSRLKEHETFSKQLREKLKYDGHKKKLILILANKSDIWRHVGKNGDDQFRKYSSEFYIHWQNGGHGQECKMAEHSNNNSEDISNVSRILGKAG